MVHYQLLASFLLDALNKYQVTYYLFLDLLVRKLDEPVPLGLARAGPLLDGHHLDGTEGLEVLSEDKHRQSEGRISASRQSYAQFGNNQPTCTSKTTI